MKMIWSWSWSGSSLTPTKGKNQWGLVMKNVIPKSLMV